MIMNTSDTAFFLKIVLLIYVLISCIDKLFFQIIKKITR